MDQAKEIAKKIYSNITNSIKSINHRMDTIFMNSANSKHPIIIDYSSIVIKWYKSGKYVALLNLSNCYTRENIKKS